MDEYRIQIIKETRKPITVIARRAQRVGYEFEQTVTASIFMFSEPLAAWLEATARESHTVEDRADKVAQSLKGRDRK